ncbi:hypothetical protein ACHAXN_004300 [Cyclotella atomus]
MAPSQEQVLAQIGVACSGISTDSSLQLASKALVHLIRSGKLSVQDASDAVDAAKIELNNINAAKKNTAVKDDGRRNNKPQEKHRTRHVALQFSYDGTDFTGFAQNIGKEEDNSVEKALFAALEKTRLLLDPSLIDFSTRGDAGESGATKEKEDVRVHANGQVVAMYLRSAFPIGAKLSTDAKQPGELLQEDDLPKNSLDCLECYVQRRNKKVKQNDDTTQLEFKTVTEYDYPRILNNILPPSIRVLGWCPVSPEFSARFSCSRRTYRYFFPRRNLDLDAMADGLCKMIGRHDFRNLCKMNCEQVYNFERMVVSAKIISPQAQYKIIEVDDDNGCRGKWSKCVPNSDDPKSRSPRDMIYVEVIGQAFLWHQIRCIMAVLFLIGRGLERPEVVDELLDITKNPAKPSYDMASENALVLQDCAFANLVLGRSVKNLWDVTKVLETRWEKHAVAAGRACDLIDTLKEEEVRWSDLVEFVQQISSEKRRKEQKKDGFISHHTQLDTEQLVIKLQSKVPYRVPPTSGMISWKDAVNVIEILLDVPPHLPNGVNESTKGLTESTIHTPLMERAKGTTYEEKVKSILESDTSQNGKTSKRKERYEENIIKKRKTTEEDKAFYDHMLKQGGSSV